MQNPLTLFFRSFLLWVKGRVHFPKNLEREGLEDGAEKFVAFRKVLVEPNTEQPTRPDATFRVRFRFKNLSTKANCWLSLIPIPLILSQPGFRSKTWLLGQQTGDFIGLYEFDSVQAAEAYWNSLPLRMMRRRAARDSLTYEVSQIGRLKQSKSKGPGAVGTTFC